MLWFRDEAFQKVAFILELVVLLHVLSTRGQHSSTTLPIVAVVGDDVLLPCRLESAADPVSLIVEWGRPDLKPRFVHVWHEGQNLLTTQNPSYKGRTLLSMDKLKQGDLSLTLFRVKLSDSGTYRCFIPKLNRESTVKLIVGSVSLPFISGIDISNSIGALQCESKGWYPEPDMLCLDSEGNLLLSEPTETHKDPDGLFTVGSKLTVERTSKDSFTCRVQQKNINQTRETIIQITRLKESDECSSSSASHISITLVVIFICALAVFLIVWKYKQNKKGTMMKLQRENEELRQKEQLMANVEHRGQQEDTEETKKELEEQLQREKQRTKDFKKVVETLRTQTQGLKKVTEELKNKAQEMDRKKKETEKQVELVERETKSDKVKVIIGLKEIIHQHVADERKMNLEKLELDTEILHIKATNILKEIDMEAMDNQGNICVREDKKH